jgi:hypothetical protein
VEAFAQELRDATGVVLKATVAPAILLPSGPRTCMVIGTGACAPMAVEGFALEINVMVSFGPAP